MKSLRILPVTVIAMLLVFGLKVGTFWNDAQGLIFGLDVAEVQAETKEDPKEDAAKTAQSPATEANGDSAEATGTDEAEAVKEPFDAASLSESEIEVLQKLTERREQLDSRSAELDMRDNLLQATEKRIDGKIAKLKEIEGTIQDLLKQYDDQELKRLKSLVVIYEKMKPKDAAGIFNSLDMDVLLDITGLMKESKLAVILGNMDGKRAKELTIELATRKQLPDVKGGKG
jgi:flagellar motility protein MotE (MotC chaperone)